MGKLTDRAAKAAGVGRHGDGDGLYLIVSGPKSKRWVLRYQINGKRRDMGVGSFPEVTLASARLAAANARAQAAQGVDPIAARDAARTASKPLPTFREIAADVIREAQARTANEKVKYQIARHLGPAYCGALLDKPVNTITTLDVAATLRPVWRSKPEVSRKLHPAIRRVFEHARIVLRDRHGVAFDNPARWDDLKAMGFEAPRALSRGRHPSLPYPDMPEFVAALRQREATTARLLEFIILSNARSGAARAATWEQFDLDAAIWTVPVANLKDKKHRKEAFRVPLSARAVAIVREMEQAKRSKYIFASINGLMLSDMATGVLLKRMATDRAWLDPTDKRPIVPHGFRATFRTWCEEVARFPHAVVEECMGHAVGNAVERAYRRTDVLEQRRALMDQWAAHCEPKTAGANVVPMKSKRT